MGRSFTPSELLAAEFVLNGKTWADVASTLTIQLGNEPPKPMYTEQEIEIIRKYNFLGRTYQDDLIRLYAQGYEKELLIVENEIQSFIENNGPMDDSVISRWFYGKLDPTFYYEKRNNELFAEYIMAKREADKDAADE